MKTTNLILASIFIFASQLHSQYKAEWMADYTTAGNVSIDKAQFIAIDEGGNIIVTGVTNGSGINDDLTTIKYDKSGKQLWVAIYNGPGNYHDRPNGMVIDQFSNVYITGGSTGDNNTATDYFTVKYNTSGAEMWVARYASPGGSGDESMSIAVDQLGNVYITGKAARTVTDNSGMDWFTIKYNTNGQQIWAIGFDDQISNDGATALTIDPMGNVYVAGQCNSPAYTIAVIKYDSSGNQKWIARYNGSAISDDKILDIKLDKINNVYITGYSSEQSKDFLTMKYDNNGNEIWKKNFNNLSNISDEAYNLQINDSGDVCVLGVTFNKVTKKHRSLVKYDKSGNEVWNKTSAKTVSHYFDKLSMIIDNESNMLVTGSTQIVSEKDKIVTDMVVDCIDKNGTVLWQTMYSVKDKIPVASALAIDELGNIYATGFILEKNGFQNYCTVKFSR